MTMTSTKASSFTVSNRNRLHSSIFNETLREWQSVGCEITPKNLMYPIFIIENDDDEQPIESMPLVFRYGLNKLKKHLEDCSRNGLKSVLLFSVIETLNKDETGSNADSKQNPVIKALPKLREWFPHLTIAVDVCLCPYTSHGHCGILKTDGVIDNEASLERISDIALAYVRAGAQIVAPSDMMDGRIGAIKTKLVNNGFGNNVAVLSYTAKFASTFYTPFRDAAKSSPAYGDRKRYQLPIASTGLALRAAARDVNEGADMLMVKPGGAYLDIVKEIKTRYPEYPMFVYQVSGEYAMILHSVEKGTFQCELVVMEVLTSLRRAGADVIISYFTPTVLSWIKANGC